MYDFSFLILNSIFSTILNIKIKVLKIMEYN